jgi:methionyl aminopeptidase
VPGYYWASCINLNDGVVHGIPDETPIKKDDYVSVDLGFFSHGFHTDLSWTIKTVDSPPRFAERGRGRRETVDDRFLKTGEEALKKAIDQVKPENRVGQISKAIEQTIKKAGYQPIRALTGHGVGHELHQEPAIPCFLKGKISQTPLLKKGMVLAIEVIYTQGEPGLVMADDGWTITTQDGKIAGLFEETVAVTANGHLVLTS